MGGKRRGQGRPLGILAAWLMDPELHIPSRGRQWVRPTEPERALARHFLQDEPNSELLFDEERDSQLGHLEEPPLVD